MMEWLCRSRGNGKLAKGQSLVEFALILPVLVALIATIAFLMSFFFQNWGLSRVTEELGNRIIALGAYTPEIRNQILYDPDGGDPYANNFDLHFDPAVDTLQILINGECATADCNDWDPPVGGVSFNYGDRISVSIRHPATFPLLTFVNWFTPTSQWSETAQRTGDGISGSGVFPGPIGISQTSLTATVTDIETGLIIDDAVASLQVGGVTRSLSYIGSGQYKVENINPPSSYTLRVSAAGYKTYSDVVDVSLATDNTVAVALSKPASIEILVTDELGTPLTPSPRAVVSGGSLGAHSVDDFGLASFADLAPGTYTLVASASGYASESVDVTVASSDTASMTVALSTASILSGRVCDTTASTCDNATNNNRTIPGATISWGSCPTGADPDAICTTTTDANGRYSMQVPAGTGSITIQHAGYQSVTDTLSVGPGTTTYYAKLVEYGFLSGRVTDPVTGVSGVQVTISPATSPAMNPISSNTSGYYTSDQYLEPDVSYTATYTASGYINKTYTFTADEGLNTFNFVMNKVGTLKVTVNKAGTPTAGYVVNVTCSQSSKCGSNTGTGTSGASGIAIISNLVPGRYSLSVSGTSYTATVTVRSGPEETLWTVALP